MANQFPNQFVSLLLAHPTPLCVAIVGTSVALIGGQALPSAMMGGVATAVAGIGGVALTGQQQKRRLATLEAQSETSQSLSELKPKVENLKSQKNSLDSEVRILKEKEQALQTQIQELEARLNTGRGSFQELQGRAQQVQQQVKQLTQQEETCQQRLAALEQSNPDWRTRDQLLAQIEQHRQQTSSLTGQIQGLQAEVERLEAQRQCLSTMDGEVRSREVTLADLNRHLEQTRENLAGFEAQLVNLEFARQTYDRLFAEKERLQTEVDRLQSEKIPLEEELQRIQAAIASQVDNYAKADRIRQELVDLEQKQRELRGEIRELEFKEAGLQADCDSWQSTRSGLERTCRQLEQEIEDLNRRIKEHHGDIEAAIAALKEPLWKLDELPRIQRSILDEITFVKNFQQQVKDQGFQFSPRVINAFHTSLKVQGISALAVLAGISGTGKSELPRLYAEYLGAQFLLLSVQPRWDSPQDLLGFYNYIENKFKPTALVRGLYQYQHSLKNEDRIVLVLLDEMNLARVEYYFSEFLSKLETRRNSPGNAYLDIDLGSLKTSDETRRFYIPKQFLFVGTMNEDETTQTLSDKVLDRANVLTFGKPQQLKIGKRRQEEKMPAKDYVTYGAFQSWYRDPTEQNPIVQHLQALLDETNGIMESLGHPFAHRVYQAIVTYVLNYPGVNDPNSESFRHALADQFAQKLLPKLRGVMVEERDAKEGLVKLESFIDQKIGDTSLRAAFEQARQGKYGQFLWKGLVYAEEGA